MVRVALLCLSFWLPASVVHGAETTAAQAFEQLSGLVGRWQGEFADGRVHTIDYRLSAGGSVLVETWALAPGRESMTLYHLDGERLLATHYCPQGNQPRLVYRAVEDGALQFQFLDGTGLQDRERAHQHAFAVRLPAADGAMERSETYVANGSDEEGVADAFIRYRRLGAQD